MLDFETPFRARARKPGLKSPRSKNFDMDAWRAAYENAPYRTDMDGNLLAAAIWFATETARLREDFTLVKLKLQSLGSRVSTILAIAVINREYNVGVDLTRDASANAHRQGALAFDHISSPPIAGGMPGQSATVASFVEIAVDAAGSWLYDTYNEPADAQNLPADLTPMAVSAIQRYSVQYGLNHFWNQALWEDWHLRAEDGAILWTPGDRRLATLKAAWLARQESGFSDFFWIDQSVWAGLPREERRRRAPRTVLGVKSGAHRKFSIGRPPCFSKFMPSFLAEKSVYECSYLAQFYEEPFPNDSRLSCELLSRTWHVIVDLAIAMMDSVSGSSRINEAQARDLALIVGRSELTGILVKALREELDTVCALIEFLSFRHKVYRGLWAAPLVPIPGEDKLALALPVLMTGNPLRKAEAWLAKGGIDDSQSKNSRGLKFEVKFRNEIRRVLKSNSLLLDARCAERAIPKDSEFGEEIDLLIQVGSLLLVGEVKCHFTPTEPQERYNHVREKLRGASKQAKAKATLLSARPDVVASALEITEKRARELRVVPLVVDSQGFGLSLEVDGCRVTDARFLLSCLGSGKLVTDAVLDLRTGQRVESETVLYSDQAEAEQMLEQLLADPPTLKRFTDRIYWGRSKFPTTSSMPFFVEVSHLGDFVENQRRAIEKLRDSLFQQSGSA